MLNHREQLQAIRTFPQLVRYLHDELDWPISQDKFEDITFPYTPEELGIDVKVAPKIQEIRRLRPLSVHQPWGIFFVKFEPKRLPVIVMRRILNAVAIKNRASAVNADKITWASDDLLFISNYGEEENRQITFAHFTQNQIKKDLPTLNVLGWDNRDTALHLDHVSENLSTYLSWPADEKDVKAWRNSWRSAFSVAHREGIDTSKKLSIKLAGLARNIRDRINSVLEYETENGPITKLMNAFKEALVHDLDNDGFADMYAQTIAYGLLSARIANPSGKTADDFASSMPVTNPFLKELMETFIDVGGRDSKKGNSIRLDFDELGVSEVVELLDAANMEAVVQDFGDKNPLEDPVTHFYEQFFADYDNAERFKRGVFYTPRPVVSFIVRSVDELLRTEFGLKDGLADLTTWGEMVERMRDLDIPDGVNVDQVFVQILDPATGTGTFLVEVIDQIHKTMVEKWRVNGHGAAKINQLWNDYVPKHLLPRLHGYELMMAPYAIAHMKIGLKLYETGYSFKSNERARVYLTNSLEPSQEQINIPDVIVALAHEVEAVNTIKRDQRFTVVIGNPPYSKSASIHPWSMELVDTFRTDIHERKSDLTREEWKFLRYSYWVLEQTNIGISGYIINNAFLSAPTLRGIRRFLTEDTYYFRILDLHGDSRKGETTPDGSIDQNVFDIQQGVCVQIGIVNNHTIKSRHVDRSDIYGLREFKYAHLNSQSVATIQYDAIKPIAPNYFFRNSTTNADAYGKWISLPDIFQNSNTGIQTKNDSLFTDISSAALSKRMDEVLSNIGTDESYVRDKYKLKDSAGWQVSKLNGKSFDEDAIRPFLYKPFDKRYIYYDSSMLGRARQSTMNHMMRTNLALVATRQVTRLPFGHVFVSRSPIEEKTGSHDRTTQLYPLYLYPDSGVFNRLEEHLQPQISFSKLFISGLSKSLDLKVIGNRADAFLMDLSPEDVFYYIYAILYSPEYRSEYGQELMEDFPRIPIPVDLDLLRHLVPLGSELVSLHLMESSKLDQALIPPIGFGEFGVEKISFSENTVWIDRARTRGFIGVSEEAWNFHIGGYQVCEKWLKDREAKGGKNPRPGRVLTDEDIEHYQKIVVAISETIRIMGEIDEVIDAHGGWPGAFQS